VNVYILIFTIILQMIIDFALIMEGKRTFGYDNLGGWHKHPVENPEMHKYCEKPDIEGFSEKLERLYPI